MKTIATAGLLFVVSLLTSCSESYATQHFSFPPSSQPHANDWEYQGMVAMPVRSSEIRVTVVDRERRELLSDTVQVGTGSWSASAQWLQRERFSVELRPAESSGNPTPAPVTLHYEWDNARKVFKRVPAS